MQWDLFFLIRLIFLRPWFDCNISANIIEIIYFLVFIKQYKQSLSLSDQSLGLNFSPVFFFPTMYKYFTSVILHNL